LKYSKIKRKDLLTVFEMTIE